MENARLNVTWAGNNGDLPDPVPFDSTDTEVRQWAEEALRQGGIPGIPADADADLTDFVVERFPAGHGREFNLALVRPKTPFGC